MWLQRGRSGERGRAAEFPCNNFLQLFFQRHVPLSLSHTSGLDTPMWLLPNCRAPFSAFLMPACGHHCEAHDQVSRDDFRLYPMTEKTWGVLSCLSANLFLLISHHYESILVQAAGDSFKQKVAPCSTSMGSPCCHLRLVCTSLALLWSSNHSLLHEDEFFLSLSWSGRDRTRGSCFKLKEWRFNCKNVFTRGAEPLAEAA